MILSLSLVWGASLLVLAAANKIYWNTEWTRILSGSALPALIIGGLAYSFLSENVVTRCWVSTVPRRPSAFRSIGGFVMIIVVTELVSLLVAALAGWFSK